MQYNKLGRTDLKVSTICLGTMTWGQQNTLDDGHDQMNYAFDKGVNFFDTAEMYAIPPTPETYGKTEKIIGSWFSKTGNRDKVILASKIAGPAIPWIRGGNYKIDRRNITQALENSLHRLQSDYIDLYQLHWPNRGSYHFSQQWEYAPDFLPSEINNNFMETLQTLEGFIRDGKIRHIGLSNETSWGMMKWLRLSEENSLPRMASIQNEYSILCRLFDTDLQEASLAEDCGLLAWSPLAGGMVSGKYLAGARPKGSRWYIDQRFLQRDTQASNDAVSAYISVAKKHDLDVCQMALAFVNSRPFVTSNIIGATSIKQLKSNIGSIDINLSDEALTDINAVYRKFPSVF